MNNETLSVREDSVLDIFSEKDTEKKVNIMIENDSNIEINIIADLNSSLTIETFSKNRKIKLKREAQVKDNARLKIIDRFKDTITELSSTARLIGSGAESEQISFLHGKNIAANIISVHEHGDTKSNIKTRSAISKGEKATIKGLVKIEKDAKGSEGFQNIDMLMLDKGALADADPNLEIDNNEVKCSHSATITRIDEEKIFYMKSRGIKEKKAKEMIIDSFMEWDEEE
jgi:Fe-S cluster assembly protein SufD